MTFSLSKIDKISIDRFNYVDTEYLKTTFYHLQHPNKYNKKKSRQNSS